MLAIISLSIIISAFYWLLRETDYMRVRLPVGCPSISVPPEMRLAWNIITRQTKSKNLNNFVTDPEHYSPLCGFNWLNNREHVVPEYKIELQHGGVKHTMTIKDPSVMKQIVSAMRANPKPIKTRNLSRNKLGGLVAPLPGKA